MVRFETDKLTPEKNPNAMAQINGIWVHKAMRRTKYSHIILDMDRSESPVHGEHDGSAYNGRLEFV